MLIRPVSLLLIFSHFVAFILLLFVSLSLPIIKPLYLLEVKAKPVNGSPPTSIATVLRFGIWGFCASSVLTEPDPFVNHGKCTPVHLGYIVDHEILDLTGHADIAQAVITGLTVVFVLHPIAAALGALTLFLVFPATHSHACGVLSLILSIVAALLTTIVLVVDFVIIGEVSRRIGPLTNGSFGVTFGNCPWMVLVATIFLWVTVIFASLVVCDCCGCRGQYELDWNEKMPKIYRRS